MRDVLVLSHTSGGEGEEEEEEEGEEEGEEGCSGGSMTASIVGATLIHTSLTWGLKTDQVYMQLWVTMRHRSLTHSKQSPLTHLFLR